MSFLVYVQSSLLAYWLFHLICNTEHTYYFEVLIHDVMDISVYFLITKQNSLSSFNLHFLLLWLVSLTSQNNHFATQKQKREKKSKQF